MIKNIFFPESVGSYYIFQKRIIGFDIGKTEVHATVISAQGYIRTIETVIKEQIENNSQLTHEEKTAKTIRSILARIGTYDAIYSALPSNIIIFKEFTLPFTSLQKIKMVLPFEVEPALPFALDTAVIDAIITRVNPAESSSDILVAAAKREYIEEQMRIFSVAGATLDKITVDMFELYGLYRELPAYQKKAGTTALIDIGLHLTRLALIINNQLKYIRVIPRGIITIGKKIQQDLARSDIDAVDHYVRFGVNKNEHNEFVKLAQAATTELLSEINFTISTYTNKLKNSEQLTRITLSGSGSEVPGLINLCETTFKIPVDILEVKKILYNGSIKSSITGIPNSFLISIATALSSSVTQEFNLQQVEPLHKEEQVFNRQVISVSALLFAIFSSFMIYSLLRTRSLRLTYNTAQKEVIDTLKKSFNIPDKSAKTVKSTLNAAHTKLADLKKKWSPLSHKSRFSFLKYLYELSRNINRAGLDLDLNSITIDQDEIIIKGRVKDVNALRTLENQLKSEYFTLEEAPQTPEFKQKPIKLKIKDSSGGIS